MDFNTVLQFSRVLFSAYENMPFGDSFFHECKQAFIVTGIRLLGCFHFDRYPIAKDKVDLETAGCSPVGKNLFSLTIIEICPYFHEDIMLKKTSIFALSLHRRGNLQQCPRYSEIKEIELR